MCSHMRIVIGLHAEYVIVRRDINMMNDRFADVEPRGTDNE